MRKLTVIDGPVTVPAGSKVELDEGQARRRRALLGADYGRKKKGGFTLERSTQFKTGETFGFGSDLRLLALGRLAFAGHPDVSAAEALRAEKAAAALQAAEADAGGDTDDAPGLGV